MEFDGIDDLANCGNNTVFDITDEISFEALIKLESTGYYPSLVTKVAAVGGNSYLFEFVAFTRRIGLILKGVSDSWLPANTTLPLGVWTHLAAVWNGSDIRFYFNGEPDGVLTNMTGTINVTDGDVAIGARYNGTYPFDGKIALVCVYNKALTAGQVQEAYEQSYRLV